MGWITFSLVTIFWLAFAVIGAVCSPRGPNKVFYFKNNQIIKNLFTVTLSSGYLVESKRQVLYQTHSSLSLEPIFTYPMGDSLEMTPVQMIFLCLQREIHVSSQVVVPCSLRDLHHLFKSIAQVAFIMTAACCWLHWFLCFLAQLNPLFGPLLSLESVNIIMWSWEHYDGDN